MYVDRPPVDRTVVARRLTSKQYAHVYLITLEHHQDVIQSVSQALNVRENKHALIRNVRTRV